MPPDRDCRAADVSPSACKLVAREAGRRDGVAGGYWTDKVLVASGLGSRTRATGSRVRVVRDPPARDRPTVAEMWDRLALVKGCDYRGATVHRGCSCLRICGLGKGRAVAGSDATAVTDRDCEACVADQSG